MKFFRPKIKIVYSFEYFLGLCEKGPRASFDCAKFRKIRNALLKDRIIGKRHIVEPMPASWDDFQLAHDAAYLETLKDPATLARILFLDYVNPFDTDILEFFMWVTGGTIRTIQEAYENQVPTFNLGGGYHHAKQEKGEGFCPVNDVVIGIRRLRMSHPEGRVLVVDLDYHQGNGTALLLAEDDLSFTFSMHQETWDPVDVETNLDIQLPHGTGDKAYMNALARQLPPVIQSFEPDLIVYVAGADPHEKDSLGTFKLSEGGMLERDRFVWEQCESGSIPLAVVAGGGYGMESWKLYYNFIKWAVQGKSDV